ncbi:hypothetical protein BKA62DRAFT_773141 [Auriculariales sp. MPI-PUGE-AT-0066]|nr:hypothetical protein BKA62DRAFT_773141 [Auriculariales sp. MPI-PUGE-AT-0066]
MADIASSTRSSHPHELALGQPLDRFMRATGVFEAQLQSNQAHKESIEKLRREISSFTQRATSLKHSPVAASVYAHVPIQEAELMINDVARRLDDSTVQAYTSAIQVLRHLLPSPSDLVETGTHVRGAIAADKQLQKPAVSVSMISSSATAYDAFKTSLLGLANLTDGLPWPLKAVPQTLLQFVAQAEASAASRERCSQLLERSQSLYRLMSQLLAKSPTGLPSDAEQHVNSFFRNLQTIVNSIQQFISQSRIEAFLEEAEASISQSLSELAVIYAASTYASVQEYGRQAVKSHEKLAASFDGALRNSSINVSAIPPPKPTFFRGRTKQVTELVNLLIRALQTGAAGHLVILGAGGIGKTTVALAILHANEVKQHFESRRYFISCEGALSASAVIGMLARLFGLRDAQQSDPLAALWTRIDKPTVIIIDNFESIWITEDNRLRQDTERLLRTLASIEHLSLVVTSRGTTLPPGIRWANMKQATLQTISLHAAQSVFADIAGECENAQQEVAVRELLAAVDCMPLAVTLLAQLAQNGESPTSLLRQWHAKRSGVLRTESTGREYNVEASIAISLDFLPSASNDPDPLQLLAICGRLPDGLSARLVEALRSSFNDIDNAIRILRKHALIQPAGDDQYKMLSPVRHFVQKQHSVAERQIVNFTTFFYDLARQANKPVDEMFPAVVSYITPEVGNIVAVLHEAISQSPSKPRLVEAVLDISWFFYHTIPSTALLEELIPVLRKAPDRQRALGRCLRLCGDSCRMLDRLSDGKVLLTEASAVFARLKDVWCHAECTMCLGMLLGKQKSYGEACQALGVAQAGFSSSQDRLGMAQCMKARGDLEADNLKYDDAQRYLKSARHEFEELQHWRGFAQCTKNLALVMLCSQECEGARLYLEEALDRLLKMGDKRGILQSRTGLAEAYIATGRFTEACEILRAIEDSLDDGPDGVVRKRIVGTRLIILSSLETYGFSNEQDIRAAVWAAYPPKWCSKFHHRSLDYSENDDELDGSPIFRAWSS